MLIITIVLGVLLAAVAAAAAHTLALRRAGERADERAGRSAAEQILATAELREAIDSAVHDAIAQVRGQASAERDAAVSAALQQSAVLQREQLGSTSAHVRQQVNADLASKKDLIDARLDQVHSEMRTELTKLSDMVSALGRTSAESFGSVANSLQAHAEVANTLAESTRSLREALANPQVRGQWGERMAEDVLRLAGFDENINYVKQTQIEGGSGRPDYTFPMPKGHALYMDVKFPMASYLRYLEVDTNAEREVHLKRFLADVRLRVRELAKRDYAGESEQPSVDYVLLFIPNEQLTGFIHEHDAGLLDEAMGQQVVLCSPLTLFAFLGVIRQAFDNFMIEQTSDEILKLLGTFGAQWRKYAERGRGREEEVRRRRQGVRPARRHTAAPARTSTAPTRGVAPPTRAPPRRATVRRRHRRSPGARRRHRDAARRHAALPEGVSIRAGACVLGRAD